MAHATRLFALGALFAAAPALALSNPFTEDFVAGSANWGTASGQTPPAWVPTGGPDASAYITGGFNFAGSAFEDTPVLLRAHESFNSSGGAFAGNWLAGGVTELSYFFRHNAPVPLTPFARIAGGPTGNTPAAVGIQFAPVLPNTWTEVTIPISPFSPQFITFENSDFNTIFSDIGNVQFGVSVPESLAGVDQTFAFDLDQASIVPAPAASVTMLIGIVGLTRRRRYTG